MRMAKEFINEVAAQWPLDRWVNFNVVVGVSGGADSVALLVALTSLRLEYLRNSKSEVGAQNPSKLIVAHFNHGTRGEESDRDQQFVESLVRTLGLPIAIGNRKNNSGRKKDSGTTNGKNSLSENSLRELRYEFLIETAHLNHARYIALGHHAQDQIETILFRIVRGTGVAGLAGIPFKRKIDDSITLIRPMLDIDSGLIRKALADWGQDFREDGSNADDAYSRNFLRQNVVPALKSKFESTFESSVLRLGRQAAEQQQFLSGLVEPFLQSISNSTILNSTNTNELNSVSIDCTLLVGQNVVVVRELLSQLWSRQGWEKSQMMFEHYDQVARLILDPNATEPGFHLPGKIKCQKSGTQLLLKCD